MLFVLCLFTKVRYRSRTGSHWCYLFCLPRCDTNKELEAVDAVCFVYQGAIQIKNWKPLMLFVLFTKVRYRSRTGSHWCYLFCLPRCDTDKELEATDAICFVYQGAIQIKNWKPLMLFVLFCFVYQGAIQIKNWKPLMLFVLFTKVQYRSRTGSCWCYLFCFVYQGAIQIKNWKPKMLFVLFCLPRCDTDKELEATDAICFVYQGAIQIKNWKPLMLFVLFTKVRYR